MMSKLLNSMYVAMRTAGTVLGTKNNLEVGPKRFGKLVGHLRKTAVGGLVKAISDSIDRILHVNGMLAHFASGACLVREMPFR
jgi:hypothetical protein